MSRTSDPLALDLDFLVVGRDMLAGGPASIVGTTVAVTIVVSRIVHRTEVRP